MMLRCFRNLVLFTAFAATSASHAAPPVTGKVIFAGVYGNGDVYVALNVTIMEAGCQVPRFDVSAQSPVAKTVLATAYAAIASGRDVVVATQGCLAGTFPTLDGSRSTYFYIVTP